MSGLKHMHPYTIICWGDLRSHAVGRRAALAQRLQGQGKGKGAMLAGTALESISAGPGLQAHRVPGRETLAHCPCAWKGGGRKARRLQLFVNIICSLQRASSGRS